MDKTQLRLRLRKQRRELTAEHISIASESLCDRLANLPEFQAAHYVALYCPFGGEIDPLGVMLQYPNKSYYLPVVKEDFKMDFRPFAGPQDCIKNQYGILEPISTEAIQPCELDLVAVPLVGFDKWGHRLGMGGGYYDRAFQHCTESTRLIGVAYQWQEIDELNAEAWDVDLHAIVTDSALIRC
jgi:5-formyltetrahydrofolate cyclo-ligase